MKQIYHLQKRVYFKDKKYIVIITKHKKYSSNWATYQLPMFVSQKLAVRCILESNKVALMDDINQPVGSAKGDNSMAPAPLHIMRVSWRMEALLCSLVWAEGMLIKTTCQSFACQKAWRHKDNRGLTRLHIETQMSTHWSDQRSFIALYFIKEDARCLEVKISLFYKLIGWLTSSSMAGVASCLFTL